MKKKDFSWRVDEEILAKMHFIAGYYDRSLNAELNQLAKKCIKNFENEYGEISKEDMAQYFRKE